MSIVKMKIASYVADSSADIEKSAVGIGAIGAAAGAIRASELTPEEADELRAHYGVSPKGGAKTRGAVRGAIGEIVGTLPGMALFRIGAGMVNSKITAAGVAAYLLGGLGGAWLGSERYSKSNLYSIRLKNRINKQNRRRGN